MDRFFNATGNGIETASLLSELLGVKISQNTLRKEMEEYLNYPSLLCIGDVLNNHGIENITAKFDPDSSIHSALHIKRLLKLLLAGIWMNAYWQKCRSKPLISWKEI